MRRRWPSSGRRASLTSSDDRQETTLDRVLGGRLALIQPASGYRFAIDPILLAACAPVGAQAHVLDLGCGVGTALLALARMHEKVTGHGIDKLGELIELANANALANGLGRRVTFSDRNVGDVASHMGQGAFDLVIANPPYLKRGTATISKHPIKEAATAEDEHGLGTWVEAARHCLRQGGGVLFIHRHDRIQELLAMFGPWFGGAIVLPLMPRTNAAPKRGLVFAIKGAAPATIVLPGLVLHGQDGGWSREAKAILEEARPYDLLGAAKGCASRHH